MMSNCAVGWHNWFSLYDNCFYPFSFLRMFLCLIASSGLLIDCIGAFNKSVDVKMRGDSGFGIILILWFSIIASFQFSTLVVFSSLALLLTYFAYKDKYNYKTDFILFSPRNTKSKEPNISSKISDKPQEKTDISAQPPIQKEQHIINSYPRDANLKDVCISKANYQCELNCEYKTFISKSTNKNYMEAHHIIPLKYQNKFNKKLDCLDNLICLCPTCHKAIHYGTKNVQQEILVKIFTTRNPVNININEYFDLY